MIKRIQVVGAVIQNQRQEILCALRSPNMSMAGHWEFPGGKLQDGETLQEALKREIHEELGCEIKVLEKIVEAEHVVESRIIRLYTFWAEIVSGVPEPKEHAAIQWLPLGELPRLKWAPADLPTVEKIVSV